MNLRQLYRWGNKVTKKWTRVDRHDRANIGHFSRGVVLAKTSHIRQIAGVVGGKSNSQRRRLQRFLNKRASLSCFVSEWTQTVIKQLKQRQVVLVVDETKLRDQIGVMVVGVVVGQRCIPLAWECYRANSAADYPAEGQAQLILKLLGYIQAGMPTGVRVRVLADRGIGTSPQLIRGITDMGWTYLFRVTRQSKVLLTDDDTIGVTFYQQVTQPGETYEASGRVFKRRGRVPAHVRVVWGEQAKAPWALVTNDPQLKGWEYAQRMWIEEAFRDLKSHGWAIEDAALDDPHRIQRLWILLVVAYTWMLLIGLHLEAQQATQPTKRRQDGSRVRSISLFREGRQAFLAAPFH